jgi:hypothetical protein
MQKKLWRAMMASEPSEPSWSKGGNVDSRSSPRDKVGDEACGCRGLRQSKMAMAEAYTMSGVAVDGPITGRLSGSEGRKPIHCLSPSVLRPND